MWLNSTIDITLQTLKLLSRLSDVLFDLVITACDHADESCPAFSERTKVVHVGLDDSPKFAKSATAEVKSLGHYRRVHDEIEQFVEARFGELVAAIRCGTS